MIAEILRTAKFFREHPVTRSSSTGAWRRWFRWQLRSRLLSGPFLVPWVESTKLMVERGMTGATGNIYCGLHEFADMAFVLHFLNGRDRFATADFFVDVGANVGSYSVLAAGVVGAETLAIEPVPKTFESLIRNITANNLQEKVDTFEGAVGARAGLIQFSTDRGPMNQVVDTGYMGDSKIVPVRTLDDLLAERRPTILKIDVEGFESEVLSGAVKTLSNPQTQAILLECNDEHIAKTMCAAGFYCVDYDPFKRAVVAVTARRYLGNHLWVRDSQLVEARCCRARRFSVYGFPF